MINERFCYLCENNRPGSVQVCTFRQGRRVFREPDGRWWNGRKCPDCNNRAIVELNYKNGKHRPIDQCRGRTQRLGRVAERIAAKELALRGYADIELNSKVIGPDISYTINGQRLLVEVKSAIRTVSRGTAAFTTGVIRPVRQNDDLVAIVFPNNKVHIWTMREHLAGGLAQGKRSIRFLVEKYYPEWITKAR